MSSTVARDIPSDRPTGASPAAATSEMHAIPLVSGSSDHCSSCAALLASDQHYCLQCGEPRGTERRLPFAAELTRTATTAVAGQEVQVPPRRRADSALIVGIGTLLLAMGVGVLIGRSGGQGTTSSKAPPLQVITVAGTGTTAATGTSGVQKQAPKAVAPKAVAAPPVKKGTAAAAATSAVKSNGQVTGTKGKVVHFGQNGKGPGYQHGKFTGNFFGSP